MVFLKVILFYMDECHAILNGYYWVIMMLMASADYDRSIQYSSSSTIHHSVMMGYTKAKKHVNNWAIIIDRQADKGVLFLARKD